ncbi:hypothetical protein Mapa_008346 [Marchantia paleacea]|nr:hypothetical protein Mapa_008346 [Marchantia paleacea]
MILNLSSQDNTEPSSGWNRALSRLPLGISSYTSRNLSLSKHQPSSFTTLRCRSWLMMDTSAMNSLKPCFDSLLTRFTAID